MPLPLIPILIGTGSALLGALGIKKGLDAKEIYEKAEKKGKKAERDYEKKKKEFSEIELMTKNKANDLSHFKRKIYSTTVQDFLNIFEKFKKVEVTKIKTNTINFEFTASEIKNFQQQAINFEESAKGLLGAAATGAAAGFGSLGLIGAIGTASTGTAISSLAGAAASNATLAWLGGGALSAGGLGIAGGTVVLGGIFLGPTLAVGGFFLAGKAEEALTKAVEYEQKVKLAIEQMDAAKVLLNGITIRIQEIINIATILNNKLIQHIIKLNEIDARLGHAKEYKTEDLNELDLKILYITFILAKSLKNILEVPILDNEGNASNKSKETCSEINKTLDMIDA